MRLSTPNVYVRLRSNWKCVAENSFFLLKLPSKKTGDGIDDISSTTACWSNICPVIDVRGSALQPVSLRHLWFLIDAGSGAWWRADLWPTSRHHSLGFPCHRNISLSSYSFQLDWTFWRCLTLPSLSSPPTLTAALAATEMSYPTVDSHIDGVILRKGISDWSYLVAPCQDWRCPS